MVTIHRNDPSFICLLSELPGKEQTYGQSYEKARGLASRTICSLHTSWINTVFADL